jgi:hypothetical protein
MNELKISGPVTPGLNQYESQVGTYGAAHTFEQSANGYDPSIGRVVVEQSNNGLVVALTNGVATASVKTSPGFVKGVTVTVLGAIVTPTHLAIYDNTAASGTLLELIALDTTGKTTWIDTDCLATTGIYLATVTVANATGVPTNAAPAASTSVVVGIAYR